ncbi:MAG: hypothetical protein UY83_C0009G0015 [Candidatus Adlerbacteria bacterium GW2011_GWA1_54_10]|uniref:CARDB domain-containing protein n=3 Tax=Candidatus Adleribacteriota TaxID=1752736 RepID=A0A0G2A3F2_9BACT|nr:MAG: hypothetical protein UY83_C0009G0015 [Candidatus Adlerbacteria bacterium GW2011_GWA1_54_10]KKW38055.1 MAG: hypothetical protein UY86_C0001G0028 [Candidatus Adlerbacteria bacterium GW2011_GWB1_54_7]
MLTYFTLQTMANNNTFKDNALRVIAVLGLIAVLLLGAWGIIQLAFFIPSFFSNLDDNIRGLFTREKAEESLSVSLPMQVTSGQVFALAWDHKNKDGEYSYAISYACAQGLKILAPLPRGQAQEVPCNTPFNYTNELKSVSLTPVLSGAAQASTTFAMAATKLETGEFAASGSGSTMVRSGSIQTGTQTDDASGAQTKKSSAKKPSATPSSSYVPSAPRQQLYGYPDLAVRITSNFGTVRAGQRLNLQFTVENVSTNVTPQDWSFVATLPYNPTYTYQSAGQQALYPGDKIVYNLAFDAAYNSDKYCIAIYPPPPGCEWYGYNNNYSGGSFYQYGYDWYVGGQYYPYGDYGSNYGYSRSQTATIQIDPYNLILESNKANNSASVNYTVY